MKCPEALRLKTDPEIYHNVKIKSYPDGTERLTICSKPIFREHNYERVNPPEKEVEEHKPQKAGNDVRPDAIKRAKEKCFDIAMLNSFDYFVTWTLDPEKIDRYDPQKVSKKLQQFLKDMTKRHNLRYLIIPEHHEDGAIHMHGLISGDIKLVDSGHRVGDKAIYNMPQWKYGWSTAIPTYGKTEHIAKYITKYITKDFRKIFGNFTTPVGISTGIL